MLVSQLNRLDYVGRLLEEAEDQLYFFEKPCRIRFKPSRYAFIPPPNTSTLLTGPFLVHPPVRDSANISFLH
jgi:hypothetical protein